MASSKGPGCGAAIGAVVIVLIVIGAISSAIKGDGDNNSDSSSSSSSTPTTTQASKAPEVGDELGAQTVCETFVKRRLKAPSTADFSGAKVTQQRGGLWRVAGAVDAQNSFGAKLRDYYTCRVRFQHGDTYKLVSLTGLS